MNDDLLREYLLNGGKTYTVEDVWIYRDGGSIGVLCRSTDTYVEKFEYVMDHKTGEITNQGEVVSSLEAEYLSHRLDSYIESLNYKKGYAQRITNRFK